MSLHSSPVQSPTSSGIVKSPTGIRGLDEILGGGFPAGRATLLFGGPGCGKSVIGLEFALHGAQSHEEPALFVSFEEPERAILENTASFGWNLAELRPKGLFEIDYIEIPEGSFVESGDYDLEPLMLRIEAAIDRIGAQRVVLDTLEKLYGQLESAWNVRVGVSQLLHRLKERGVTVVFTAEARNPGGTRLGFEDYLADCAVFLDHRIIEEISTRRLRVVKYRGASHETNEYPYLIDDRGISVFPLTSLSLDYPASDERVSTGMASLDEMLSGGFYKGSSVLVSGVPGSGKTSIAAQFAERTCRNGYRALYLSFEEPMADLLRNMRSIGIDLKPHTDSGALKIHSSRPSEYSMEKHLMLIYRIVEDARPDAVIFDPISSIHHAGTTAQARAFLIRLIDYLRSRGITTLFTDLIRHDQAIEHTADEVSSLMDTWIVARDLRGERRARSLFILKARGTAHSSTLRELHFGENGVELGDVLVK